MIKPSTASKEHLPVIKSASGCFAHDVDGKEYLDFTGSNLTVILGHQSFVLNYAPNFPGKSFLEDEVSERLSELTKTNHFRYFKNGHNAVDCALRLSRHILGDQFISILFVGYHGVGDLYVSTFNQNGLPLIEDDVYQYKKDTHLELDSIDYDVVIFESRYEKDIKKIKAKLKICDHLKSGINGLWEKVDADFHLYGKSLANGYPVAVLTGRDDYMKRIDEIYYSTTFGGDNVGLEAIHKTMNAYDRSKWLELKEYADSVLPPWQSLKQEQIKKFTKQCVLFTGYWQIMTSHTKEDIDRLASLCKKIL
jgi:glutamate-1-semialdehyde 2,1-aminomutase